MMEAVFDRCDLTRAVFHRTNLEKADFTSAVGYSIDPELNHLKKAKFASQGLLGLLEKHELEVE